MSTPTEVVQQVYAAFGRCDIPGILATLTDDVDWRFHASPSTGIPYGGKFMGKKAVEGWFTTLAQNDDIQQFEPRDFSGRAGSRDGARLGAREAAPGRQRVRHRVGPRVHGQGRQDQPMDRHRCHGRAAGCGEVNHRRAAPIPGRLRWGGDHHV